MTALGRICERKTTAKLHCLNMEVKDLRAYVGQDPVEKTPGLILRIGFINRMIAIFGALEFDFAKSEFQRIYGEDLNTPEFVADILQRVFFRKNNPQENSMQNSNSEVILGNDFFEPLYSIERKGQYFFDLSLSDEDKDKIIESQKNYEPYHIDKDDSSIDREKLSSGDFSFDAETEHHEALRSLLTAVYAKNANGEGRAEAAAALNCKSIAWMLDSVYDIDFERFSEYARTINPQISLIMNADEELNANFMEVLKEIYNNHRFWRYNGHTALEISER